MEHNKLKELAEKILKGEASDEEVARYNRWFESFQKVDEKPIVNAEKKKVQLQLQIRKDIGHKTSRKIRHIISIAAAILLFIGAGSYYFFLNQQHSKATISSTSKLGNQIIAPGKDQAILTLANGKRIILDHAQIGQIARQRGTSIVKSDKGSLIYQTAANQSETQASQFNEVNTPRGGQYKIVLPDGTKVWLNSASSIRFPTSFNAKERDVVISGEVYFEVMHNALKPFIVSVKNVKVKVLGTHFDVNAYADNGFIKTTLLKGSVQVTKGNQQVLIAPGEQANVFESGNSISVEKVNTANIVAWTQGFLSLEDIDLKEFMANLSRWYDVDVVYDGKIPNLSLGGLINRNTNLSDVLSALKTEGVNTKLEGRKIIVSF